MAAFEQAVALAVPLAVALALAAALLLDEMLEHPAVISPRPATAAIAALLPQPAPSLTLLIGHFLLKGHILRVAGECLSCGDDNRSVSKHAGGRDRATSSAPTPARGGP